MNAPALIAAITAAAYAESEEPGVQIVAARSADLADHWFVVEGVRKSFRRIYVVALRAALGLEPVVVEVMGGSRMNDEALILTARRAIEGGLAVGGGAVPATRPAPLQMGRRDAGRSGDHLAGSPGRRAL